MNPRWSKVIRDLWGNRGRTILVTLAIAVGVFAFGSVFVTRIVLLSDMDTQYKGANPASIQLYINDGFGESLISYAESQPEIEFAEGRVVNSIKMQRSNKSETVNLITFKGENQINKILPEKGAWPPVKGEIFFERGSLSLVDSKLGEDVTLDINGKLRQVKYAGSVFDVTAIPARFFPQLTAYTSTETLQLLGLPSKHNQLNLVATEEYQDIEQINDLSNELRDKIEARGYEVNGAQTWEPDEHWGKDPSKAFVTILMGVGFISLGMSALLVVNTISSVIAQQKKQIGTMKALGASSGQISQLYLATVIVYGVLALFVAYPIGMLLAYLNLVFVTNFLNVNIVNFRLPLGVAGMMAAASLLVPLIAAFVPIRKTVNVSVAEALGDRKKSQKSRIIEKLSLVSYLSNISKLSLRNSFRNNFRLLLTLGTMTLAGMLFISVINLRGSFRIEMQKAISMDNFDLKVVLKDKYPTDSVESRIRKVSGVTDVDFMVGFGALEVTPNKDDGVRIQFVGVDPESDFQQPNIYSGRWLTSSDTNAVVLSKQVIDENPQFHLNGSYKFEINDKTQIFEVVGVVRMMGENDFIGFSPIDYISQLGGVTGKASTVSIRTQKHDIDSQLAVGREVEDRLDQAGFEVAQNIAMGTIIQANQGQFDFLIAFLLFMAVLVATVGGLGLAGTMSLNILERTREIGVLRGIGSSNSQLSKIVVYEAIFVGIISLILAIPLSIPTTLIFGYAVGNAFMGGPMAFNFSFLGVIIWLLIVSVISVFASLLPAVRAIRISVREAISYE